MLELNLISRISDDKNFFIDFLYALYELKEKFNVFVKMRFIGGVESYSILSTLKRLSELLGIDEQVIFTERSIRYEELGEEVCKGYFVNLTIGTFLGYSSIECLKYKLKTIFYNVDKNYKDTIDANSKSFCSDYYSLKNMLLQLNNNKTLFDEQLAVENAALLLNFSLSPADKTLLKSIM